jgi:hypothetical protein
MSRTGWISLDTIEKLHASHRGLWGWCRRSASLYRMSAGRAHPYCGSRDMEQRRTAVRFWC